VLGKEERHGLRFAIVQNFELLAAETGEGAILAIARKDVDLHEARIGTNYDIGGRGLRLLTAGQGDE
jgi:hypothetical protein